jgi:hypothetical protein
MQAKRMKVIKSLFLLLLITACAKRTVEPIGIFTATVTHTPPIFTSTLKPTLTPTPKPTPIMTLPAGMPSDEWTLVVIGDSSLWGLGRAFAKQIKMDLGVEVVLQDFAEGGLSIGSVLEVLQTGKSAREDILELPDALIGADIVVMWANPEDSIDPDNPLDFWGCFKREPPKSYAPEAYERFTSDFEAVWKTIFELNQDHPIILRGTDIYNPVISGWKIAGVNESCTEAWENQSNAVRLAAETYNIPFLSRYDAFNGLNHDEDPREKGYIVDDGQHPSPLAAQFTAELLSQMGYEPVSPP